MSIGKYPRIEKYRKKVGKYYINLYPIIFDICHCGKCNEIVWGGKRFIRGHHNTLIENKLRQSISHKGHIVSEITKDKISQANSGENNGCYGKPAWNKGILTSQETKDKISSKLIGRKLSIETIEKMKLNRVGMKGRRHTKESNKKNSNSNKGRLGLRGKDNGMFGRTPSPLSNCGKRYYYKSPLQGMVYFRSSYELAYAKYLDSKNILWLYEMETFDLGNTTYTPDFFLPRFEKFIEIKGYMRKMAQEKINKFLDQYPWDLEILYKEDLIKLGIDL